MSTPAKRIDSLINALNLNINSFSKECGYPTSATIWRLINEGAKPSNPTLNKICNRFPQVNREWLMTGYGSMFTTQENEDLTVTAKQVIDNLKENTESLKSEIKDLKNQLKFIRASLLGIEMFHGIDIKTKTIKNKNV
tara:strand:+ start:2384 stop:2797 length:414 start_codon:yes stop_codon:yes gene_type:complete